MPPAATEIAHIPTSSKGEGEIHIASLNCKNLKPSAYIIEELLKQHQIILIQEHWLFEAQINTIGDLNKNINFVEKELINIIQSYQKACREDMEELQLFGGKTLII